MKLGISNKAMKRIAKKIKGQATDPGAPIDISDVPERDTVFAYGALLRPISSSTVPEGYIEIQEHPDFKHGVVIYDRELSERDQEHFDLVRLLSMYAVESLLADKFKEEAGEYVSEYIEEYEEDPESVEIGIGQIYDRLSVYPYDVGFDREDVTKNVMEMLKGELQ